MARIDISQGKVVPCQRSDRESLRLSRHPSGLGSVAVKPVWLASPYSVQVSSLIGGKVSGSKRMLAFFIPRINAVPIAPAAAKSHVCSKLLVHLKLPIILQPTVSQPIASFRHMVCSFLKRPCYKAHSRRVRPCLASPGVSGFSTEEAFRRKPWPGRGVEQSKT